MNNTEQIFNLYYFVNLDIITEVGVVVHEIAGTDKEKIQYLKDNYEKDFNRLKKFEIPDGFSIRQYGVVKKGIDHASYRDLCNQGHSLLIYENIFREYGASASPLVLFTPVFDGKIKIEGVEDLKTATTFASICVYQKTGRMVCRVYR